MSHVILKFGFSFHWSERSEQLTYHDYTLRKEYDKLRKSYCVLSGFIIRFMGHDVEGLKNLSGIGVQTPKESLHLHSNYRAKQKMFPSGIANHHISGVPLF